MLIKTSLLNPSNKIEREGIGHYQGIDKLNQYYCNLNGACTYID